MKGRRNQVLAAVGAGLFLLTATIALLRMGGSREERVEVVGTADAPIPETGVTLPPFRESVGEGNTRTGVPPTARKEGGGNEALVSDPITVRYVGGEPAAGLTVHPVHREELPNRRRVLCGASVPLGVLDEHGRLFASLDPGRVSALAFVHGASAATIVPVEQVLATSEVVLERPVRQRVVLGAARSFLEEPASEYVFTVTSRTAGRFGYAWHIDEAAPEDVFAGHHLCAPRIEEVEYYFADRWVFMRDFSELTVVIPAVRCRMRVDGFPFGWWMESLEFDPSEQTLVLAPRALEIHDLVVLDADGNALHFPTEVRLAAKRTKEGETSSIWERPLPLRHDSQLMRTQFTIPRPAADGHCTIVALWDRESRVESEIFDAIPLTVVVRMPAD